MLSTNQKIKHSSFQRLEMGRIRRAHQTVHGTSQAKQHRRRALVAEQRMVLGRVLAANAAAHQHRLLQNTPNRKHGNVRAPRLAALKLDAQRADQPGHAQHRAAIVAQSRAGKGQTQRARWPMKCIGKK